MIYLINYANSKYKLQQAYNTKSAYLFGKANVVIEYSPKDIDPKFIDANKSIFKYKRGDGLWLWKPYIIKKTLNRIMEGDYLFYCDSGSILINNIQHLIKAMELSGQSMMLFELPLLERQFTKRETFIMLDYSDYSKNQILASYILLKNSEYTRNFIDTWLNYCCDERVISPKIFNNDITEFSDYFEHREDQSILSILAHKLKIPTFRDPSHYGNRPWEYSSSKWVYNPQKYENSPYPKILVSNRGDHPLRFLLIEQFRTLLSKFGIYTESSYRKRFIIQEY